MNRGVYLLIGAVLVMLAGAQVFLAARNRKPEIPPESSLKTPRPLTSSEGPSRTMQAYAYFEDRQGNWGTVIDLLVKNGLLKEGAHAMLMPSDDGWKMPDEGILFPHSGLGEPDHDYSDEAGARILSRFRPGDSSQNARSLAELVFWVFADGMVGRKDDSYEKRRERLRAMPEFMALPREIVIENCFIYVPHDSPANYGDLPAEIVDRLTFRNCAVSVAWRAAEPQSVRFERCVMIGSANAVKPMTIEMTACIAAGYSVHRACVLKAENSVFIRPQLKAEDEAMAASDLKGSVVLGSLPNLQPPPPGHALFLTEGGGWASEGVKKLSPEDLQNVARLSGMQTAELTADSAGR